MSAFHQFQDLASSIAKASFCSGVGGFGGGAYGLKSLGLYGLDRFGSRWQLASNAIMELTQLQIVRCFPAAMSSS